MKNFISTVRRCDNSLKFRKKNLNRIGGPIKKVGY